MQPVKVLRDKLVVRRLIANELIMDSLPPNGPFAADAIAAECVMPNLAVRQLTAAVFPVRRIGMSMPGERVAGAGDTVTVRQSPDMAVTCKTVTYNTVSCMPSESMSRMSRPSKGVSRMSGKAV